MNMNELDIANGIIEGALDSPQYYGNMALYALRITGTGVAFRDEKCDSDDNVIQKPEYVYRNPDNYLNQDFLDRCAGLSVLFFHPEKQILDTEEFSKRVIGSIMKAYIIDSEVWGIARIYDENAIQEMESKQLSTSPGVILSKAVLTTLKDNDSVISEMQRNNIAEDEAYPLLIEGEPALLDHLAICLQGVWDKGGEPLGVSTQQPVRIDSMSDIAEAVPASPEPSLGDLFKLVQGLAADVATLKQAEAKAAEGHEEGVSLLGDPELGGEPIVPVADAEEDMARNKAQADDMCDDDAKTRFDDDGDDDNESDNKKEVEAKVVADSIMKENAAMKAKIAAIEARMPAILSDADLNELSAAQAKADSVAHAFGDKAPAPMMGEKPLSYRRRVADMFKKYSADWKDMDLSVLGSSLGIAERAIYADAMSAANMPASYGEGVLRESTTRMRGGTEITTFSGDSNAWMGQFKLPGSKLVGINTKG